MYYLPYLIDNIHDFIYQIPDPPASFPDKRTNPRDVSCIPLKFNG